MEENEKRVFGKLLKAIVIGICIVVYEVFVLRLELYIVASEILRIALEGIIKYRDIFVMMLLGFLACYFAVKFYGEVDDNEKGIPIKMGTLIIVLSTVAEIFVFVIRNGSVSK